MPRCDRCPVRPDLPCPDEGWHCRAVRAGGEAAAEQLRRLAETKQVQPPAAVGETADLPRSNPVIAVARMINHCPHRSPPACSCNAFATCGLGKGASGQVQYGDCLVCVASPPPSDRDES